MKRVSNNKTNYISFYIRNGVDVSDATSMKFKQLGSDTKETLLPILSQQVDCHVAVFEVNVPDLTLSNGTYHITVVNSTADELLSASGIVDGFLETDPRAFIVRVES